MTVLNVIAMPSGNDNSSGGELWSDGPGRYDYNRIPEEIRNPAMLAQGTVVHGLSAAVDRVLESGRALSWAKETLPHGEYLPWVQQACGLKPTYAARLVKAAEWSSNVEHVPHLDDINDTATLFLLSADTTTEEVREWFMERCEAGDVPSRTELQERKRNASRPRTPQPVEQRALAILQKEGEVEAIRAALALADQAEQLTAEQVMERQRLRDLGRNKVIHGIDADFYRMKDGSWWAVPHAGDVDVTAAATAEPPLLSLAPEPLDADDEWREVRVKDAAEKVGLTFSALGPRLTPTRVKLRNGQPFVRDGWQIKPSTRRGYCFARRSPKA